MTTWPRFALPMSSRRRKWVLICLYWCAQAAVYFLGWPLLFFDRDIYTEPSYLIQAGVWIPAVMVLQAAFVMPIARPSAAHRPTGLAQASVAALATALVIGFASWLVMAGLGTAGLVSESMLSKGSSVWNLPFWAGLGTGVCLMPYLAYKFRRGVPIGISIAIAGLVGAMAIVALGFAALGLVQCVKGTTSGAYRGWAFGLLALFLLSWSVATPLLLAFVRRGPRETQLSRLASSLFLGTLVEAAAIIPLDVMLRRKVSCYCEAGTFWALTTLWSVGLLILGPAVYLLPLGKRRRRLAAGCCAACGYDMRGTPDADRCPECGAGWKSPSPSQPT